MPRPTAVDVSPVKEVDVSDADAAVGEVLFPKTFYSVTPPRKTGTMPTVAIVAASDAYLAGYHAGDGGGLPAIDGDLVAGNIKDGVTIFNVLGTFENTLAQDVVGSELGAQVADTREIAYWEKDLTVGGSTFSNLATKNLTFDPVSIAVGVGYVFMLSTYADSFKLQVTLGGVQVAESGYAIKDVSTNLIAVGTRALSGATDCIVRLWNYQAARSYKVVSKTEDGPVPIGIGVGSVKLV